MGVLWRSTAATLFLLKGVGVVAATTGVSFLRNWKEGYKPMSLQMTPNEAGGDPFVSAVATGRNYETVLVTGATQGMINEKKGLDTEEDMLSADSYRCFLGTLDVETLQWQQKQTYAHPGAHKKDAKQNSLACSNILLWRHKHEVFVAGHDDTSATSKGSIISLTELDMEEHLEDELNLTEKRVGKGVDPVNLLAHKDRIYMAGLTTPDENDENNHGLKVGAYKVNDDGSMDTFFKHTFYTSDNADLHIAGMMIKGWDNFIVAGHTRAQGGAFGLKSHPEYADSIDGFVTRFNAETGNIVESDEATFRFESLDGDVEIHSICHDRNDYKHVFLVGSLDFGGAGGVELDSGLGLASDKAKTRSEAVILKIDMSKKEKVWEKRMTANLLDGEAPRVQGKSCAVTPDGLGVWFGGHVYDDGQVVGTADDAKGGTDIFVSLLSVEDGEQAFVRQIGSPADDLLAGRGGLVVDTNGNAVVVGNTYGNLYRNKPTEEESPDTFISTIALATGDTAPTYEEEVNTRNAWIIAVVIVVALLAAACVARQIICRRKDDNEQEPMLGAAGGNTRRFV